MAACKLIKAADRKFERMGEGPGTIMVGRDVTTAESTTMGCSVATFEDVSMPWTLKYDEYFYCLEGVMTIKTKEGDYVMEPGGRAVAARRHGAGLRGRREGHPGGRDLSGGLADARGRLRPTDEPAPRP